MVLCVNLNSANRLDFKDILDNMDNTICNDIHIEIKDSYITGDFGLDFMLVEDIKRRYSNYKVEIHLLTKNIYPALDLAIQSKADLICFHPGLYNAPHDIIRRIKSNNIMAGVCLMPHEAALEIFSLLDFADYVNVLGTEHLGVSSPLIYTVIDKITQLNWHRTEGGLKKFGLQIDGGVDSDNIGYFLEAGADVAVLGKRGLFKNGESRYLNVNLEELNKIINRDY